MSRTVGLLLLIGSFGLIFIWGIKLGLQNRKIQGEHLEVLYFHVDGCAWCKKFEPTWNEFASKSRLENISLSPIDVGAQKELADKFSVEAVPTLLIVKNNRSQIVVGPVFPLIYKGESLSRSVSSSLANQIRPWNLCELSHFVKSRVIPKEISCEKAPF